MVLSCHAVWHYLAGLYCHGRVSACKDITCCMLQFESERSSPPEIITFRDHVTCCSFSNSYFQRRSHMPLYLFSAMLLIMQYIFRCWSFLPCLQGNQSHYLTSSHEDQTSGLDFIQKEGKIRLSTEVSKQWVVVNFYRLNLRNFAEANASQCVE